MTTHATIGPSPTCRLSLWWAGYLGYQQGWSMCGVLGLTAAVYGWPRWAAYFIGCLVDRDIEHCFKAIGRSIERASTW